MKNYLLLLLLLPATVLAQKTRFNMNNFKRNLIKTDSIKVFTFKKTGETIKENDFSIGNTSTNKIVSRKINTKLTELLKKLNVDLNPAHPRVEGNYLGCCNCCTESTVKTFAANGVYSFTPNNQGYSTTSVSISAYANVQYLVRITGSTNQPRNFTVSFGANNTQGYQVAANDFEITFIAKPKTSGNFFFTLYSNEPGLWSFYNCSVTEL